LVFKYLIEVEEFREGTDRTRSSRKLPELTKYSNLVLRRGFMGTLEIYKWWKLTANGDAGARQTIVIHLLNDEHNPVASWRLSGAFPVRYAFLPLNGLDGSPLIETLEVSCDAVEME
jgi:phage tail-like protein